MPIGPIAELVITQLAPRLIAAGIDLLDTQPSQRLDIPRNQRRYFRDSHNVYRCPSCNDYCHFSHSERFDSLQCTCGFVFPRKRGGRRCKCGELSFPVSFNARMIQCPNCTRICKLTNDGVDRRICKCMNLFEITKQAPDDTTSCCQTMVKKLEQIEFAPPVPEVPSEALRI